jgi:hypothetical protein
MTITALYADGGVIGANPSPIGGAIAFCYVNELGLRIAEIARVVTPAEAMMPTVSNNLTELLALVRGIAGLPVTFAGIIASDSWVSLQRVFLGAKLNNVPDWLVRDVLTTRQRLTLMQATYQLLDGHPTHAQLATGVRKRGHPVSEHNVWCDQA